ncbi:MAG: lysine biosynthesis protein LysW [Methanobacteriota archaeon]|nr:MAG: lysine biosynthesis protein LysW [Euryarchaeota archaeon]
MVECIECGAQIELSEPEQGEIVDCPECGTELEVIQDNPVVLQFAPQEEEDWGE